MIIVKALDIMNKNPNLLNEWKSVNEMFVNYTPHIDTVLGSGTYSADISHVYSENWEQEKKICKLLFSTNIKANAKRCVLLGAVGTGKTSLTNIICNSLLKRVFYDELVFVAYKDVQRTNVRIKDIEKDITDSLRESIIETLFPEDGGKLNLYREIYSKSMGRIIAEKTDPILMLEKGDHELTLNDYCNFLSRLRLTEKVYILVVLDNVDENHSSNIEEIISAEIKIFDVLSRYNKIFASTLIPMRQYTRQKFDHTERYAVIDMFKYPASEILRSKLKLCEEEIKNSTKSFMYKGKIITPGAVADFIANLAEAILSKKQPETFNLISALAANNLKILLGNVYNLLHSPRLPYAHLFESTFEKTGKYPKIIPEEIACQCLMAVHYPFYDVLNSWIMNVFDVRVIADGFMNTLVTYRLMCLVNRRPGIDYQTLKSEFEQIGYGFSYIHECISLCLRHGTIEASNGLAIKDVDDKTTFHWNSSTEIYMKKLIYSLSYLQYACEDTSMPEKYVVEITDKYSLSNNDSYDRLKEKRFEATLKFCKFLKEEETLEWQHIQSTISNPFTSRKDFNTYWSIDLKDFSFLADKIEKEVLRQIDIIVS